MSHSSEPDGAWFTPGTFSVWAWNRGDEKGEDGLPILCVFEEWEIAGLRGVTMVDAFSSLDAWGNPDQEVDGFYDQLRDNLNEPDCRGPRELAQRIQNGEFVRIGRMPSLDHCPQGYAKS